MPMKPVWLVTVAITAFVSCKKTHDADPNTPPPSTSRLDLLRDSVFLYSKEVYFWEDVIPTYAQFNPRQYSGSTELETAQKEMNAIRALQPLDRYSFVTTATQSASLQTGNNQDMGFLVKSDYIDKAAPLDSARWFVNYVYKNSAAGQAGVQRGWQVNKINGQSIVYDNASVNTLNEVFFGATTTATFEFIKPDGTASGSMSLSKTSFTANSVLYKDVLNAGGKKVGYLVFNQFFAGPSRLELADAFNYFTAQGINELVVDLRYNPGGSTDTQDTLANLIAPLSANGKTMYKYVFNNTLQQNKHVLIRQKLNYGNVFTEAANTISYKKAGSLNLSRVFFIVTSSTASASELLINNLRPYMDVKLVGDTTYGKPVGFFPIPLYDYALYPISFKTVNSAGTADYYTGFAPDALAADGVTKPWGDVTEPSLASVLKYISSGSFRLAAAGDMSGTDRMQFGGQQALEPAARQIDSHKFSGMYKEN